MHYCMNSSSDDYLSSSIKSLEGMKNFLYDISDRQEIWTMSLVQLASSYAWCSDINGSLPDAHAE